MPVEIIVGAVIGAAAASAKARKVLRRGLTYGLAGLLIGYDKAVAVGQGVVKGARKAVADAKTAEAEEAVADHVPAPSAAHVYVAETPAH